MAGPTFLARRHLLACAALFSMVVAGCGEHGSGNRTSQTRSASGFSEVAVQGTVMLDLSAGAHAVVLEGDDNLLPKVETTVTGGRLTIAPQGSMTMSGPIVARITSPVFTTVVASGSGDVKIKGAAGPKLVVEASGARKVEVEGSVEELVVRVSGSCTVDTRKLDAKTVSVEGSGASTVELGAPTTLSVKGSGSSSVRHGGSPAITQDVTGGASVKPR